MLETNQLYPSQILHLFQSQCVHEWLQRPAEVFKKGEHIYYPEKLTDHIYLVTKGNARVFNIHTNGKECILGIAREMDFIDLHSVFTDAPSSLYAMALTETSVIKIKKAEIMKQVMETPELSLALLRHFATKLNDMTTVLEQIAYEKVEERLLRTLWKLADQEKEQHGFYPLPSFLTHKDLAGMVASTRETITFLLNKLIQNEMIRQDEKRLWISKNFSIM